MRDWFSNNYGSPRAFVHANWHRLLYYLGRYNDCYHIDWPSIERVVFVCKGNICRSAFAEVVARSLGIEAISCGIDAIEDAPANEMAIIEARKLGFDLERHKSKPLMYITLRKSDLLVAMEPYQVRFLDRHLKSEHYCTLLGVWPQPVSPYIHDPYGTSSVYFGKCLRYIEKSVHEIANQIETTRKY